MNVSTKITGLAAAGLLAVGLATSATAGTATVNFSDYADANGEGFVVDIAPSGIAFTGAVDIFAGDTGWLDGTNTSGNPAGLGNCERPTGCFNSSLDDVDVSPDMLTIDFFNTALGAAQVVTLTELVIRSDFHFLFNGEIDVNGNGLTVVNGAVAGLSIMGSSFDFSLISGVGASDQAGFYVEAITAAVPLPAGVLLLGTALGGLGLARRRRNAA